MRGRNVLAVALRHPDGSIVWATERLDLGLRARRAMKLPLLRGLVVLYDTLVTGTRWLVRSATVQALALEDGEAKGVRRVQRRCSRPWQSLLSPRSSGPRQATTSDPTTQTPTRLRPAPGARQASRAPRRDSARAIRPRWAGCSCSPCCLASASSFCSLSSSPRRPSAVSTRASVCSCRRGLIRVVIFIGYLLLVGRAADVRRTFEYHGAEHMSIHTLEAGDPLTVEAARRYPTAHPRCGTEFLVVVLIVSILAFAVVGKLSPLWLVVSRVILVPVIAAVSYEVLQLGARNRRYAWCAGCGRPVSGSRRSPPASHRRHDRSRARVAPASPARGRERDPRRQRSPGVPAALCGRDG